MLNRLFPVISIIFMFLVLVMIPLNFSAASSGESISSISQAMKILKAAARKSEATFTHTGTKKYNISLEGILRSRGERNDLISFGKIIVLDIYQDFDSHKYSVGFWSLDNMDGQVSLGGYSDELKIVNIIKAVVFMARENNNTKTIRIRTSSIWKKFFDPRWFETQKVFISRE